MVFDDTLLDDPARVAEADAAGFLRITAMAGAQVRAAAEIAAEMNLAEKLEISRPRALVLLARSGVSHSIARVLEALLSSVCPVPVIVSESMPNWIGALDLVFAHTDDPGDHELAESLGLAARYGATIVLSGRNEGPVAAAVAGRGVILPPRMPVPAEFGFFGGLAVGLLMANTAGLLSTDLDLLAEHLDAEAERCHLSRESFANPAKGLTLRLADRMPLLWGLDPVAEAVAEHAAFALAAHAATVCDVCGYRQALSRRALYLSAARSVSEQDIFADPAEEPGLSPRLFLMIVRTGAESDALRYQAADRFPGVEPTSVVEEAESPDAIRAAVLALRFELAAVYLGLATGTMGGIDHYTPAWT